MAGYIGSKAAVVSSGAERKKTFDITGTTTSLTGLSYTVNQVHVFHNGVRLVDGTDFTATNGSSITLTSAAESGDEVVVLSYAGYQVSDTVSASQGGTFANSIDVTGTVTADGLTVDATTTVIQKTGDSPTLQFKGHAGTQDTIGEIQSGRAEFSGTNSFMRFKTNDGTSTKSRLNIDDSGDISFYEDTGTTAKFFWDASAESLGIGGTPSGYALDVTAPFGSTIGGAYIEAGEFNKSILTLNHTNSAVNVPLLSIQKSGSDVVTVDSSGNLLVGKTSASIATVGHEINGNGGYASHTRSGNTCLFLNRTTSDGDIAVFRKDGTTVGSIGVAAGGGAGAPYICNAQSGNSGLYFAGRIQPTDHTGNSSDNTVDLGSSTFRFDDIYATNGTIQTSDRNEKQDIAALTATEMLVAARISAMFKTFRWIDKVADNPNARTHTGIIAQDVQQAFTDEGLDAGDYSLFTSTTWWETQTDVPAVEAVAEVLDDDDNVVTEAVEAKDAYTRTDTYDTQAEAPAGATERTRLGIRYPELLSFIAAYNEQRFASIETRLAALEAV